jgi:hypothetical protein
MLAAGDVVAARDVDTAGLTCKRMSGHRCDSADLRSQDLASRALRSSASDSEAPAVHHSLRLAVFRRASVEVQEQKSSGQDAVPVVARTDIADIRGEVPTTDAVTFGAEDAASRSDADDSADGDHAPEQACAGHGRSNDKLLVSLPSWGSRRIAQHSAVCCR